MLSLVQYLSEHFECDAEELHRKIGDNFAKVIKILEHAPLYFPPKKQSRGLTPLLFQGLTQEGPRTLYAKGGQMGITVEQYCFLAHRGRVFRYPHLQCVKQRVGEYGGECYVPIEVILIDV
jgi:hypothetical protein